MKKWCKTREKWCKTEKFCKEKMLHVKLEILTMRKMVVADRGRSFDTGTATYHGSG